MKEKLKAIWERIWKDVVRYRAGILIFAVYYVFMHLFFKAFCPSVLLTGLPCAGCGMTRAVFFLLTGQLQRSWNMNAMALPLVFLAVYCVIERYVRGRRIRGLKLFVGIICGGMMAVYGYRMAAIFPNRPPYVYTPDNFLERTFPFYREILRRILGI